MYPFSVMEYINLFLVLWFSNGRCIIDHEVVYCVTIFTAGKYEAHFSFNNSLVFTNFYWFLSDPPPPPTHPFSFIL